MPAPRRPLVPRTHPRTRVKLLYLRLDAVHLRAHRTDQLTAVGLHRRLQRRTVTRRRRRLQPPQQLLPPAPARPRPTTSSSRSRSRTDNSIQNDARSQGRLMRAVPQEESGRVETVG